MTVASARTRYEIATQELQDQLDDLEEKQGLMILTIPQLRECYLRIKVMESQMTKAAEELIQANTNAGASAETRDVNNEVVSLQTKLGALRQFL